MAAAAAATQPGMAARSLSGLERLTRRHAVKLSPAVGVSVEECSLAVGAAVGYGSIKSASRMNSAVVIFLDCTDKVNQVVESGVEFQGTLTSVFPLVSTATSVAESVLDEDSAKDDELMNLPAKRKQTERRKGEHTELTG